MLEQLEKYLSQFIHLNEDEFQIVAGLVRERNIKKKEHLVKAGETCNKVVFFSEGYFRFYHSNTNGNEITSDFYFAPGLVTSYTSFLTGNPSFVNVQAMENIKLLEITRVEINNLYKQSHAIERFGRLIAEHIAINSENHLFLLLNQTAEERYKRLLAEYPMYVQRIPLQYIASYLSITQETLSRMRRLIH